MLEKLLRVLFNCLVITLVYETSVQAAERGSMLKRRGRVGGREVQPVNTEALSGMRKKVLKVGWERTSRLGTSLYRKPAQGQRRGWQPTNITARRREMTVWHLSSQQWLQKSVLKGKEAQLMGKATLMPWPKADRLPHWTCVYVRGSRRITDLASTWDLGTVGKAWGSTSKCSGCIWRKRPKNS